MTKLLLNNIINVIKNFFKKDNIKLIFILLNYYYYYYIIKLKLKHRF